MVYKIFKSMRLLTAYERINLLKKAFILYSLGDINKAKYYFDCIQDESELNYLMPKLMINIVKDSIAPLTAISKTEGY
ncbi:hypothetical protein [Tissierella sp. Yu-01]|uniref:hypothetical protein n=1 Tax=Tissierella sp. Yu-01 TaxID=3035694 RepID=UPI00240D8BFD|nr:hypothetical protein [Tissierella sp. Yu-01]WFA08525.1 hypothetical protein P3962_12460 [Tissierella sp. Yu-01]